MTEVLDHAVRMAIIKNAEDVLSYVFDEGAPVPASSQLPGQGLPTSRVLNLLLAHGWDINARPHGNPFLWQAVAGYNITL